MIKVIFFDFDGTISDSRKIVYLSMIKILEENRYKFSKKELLNLMGNKMQVILKKLDLEVKDLEIVRKKFYKYITKAVLDKGIRPCVSLKPLWKLSNNYPLIIISNSETSFLKASIRKLELKGLFKKVYGAEKFRKKDEMLKKLFKKMKIKSHEAIYVGDRFSDIEYARKSGCIAIAIHNKCSWSNLKTIKREKPNFIIKDFKELKKLIENLNSH